MGGGEGSQVSGGLVLQGLGAGYRRCIWLQWDPVCHQALQGETREGGPPALWHAPTWELGPGQGGGGDWEVQVGLSRGRPLLCLPLTLLASLLSL